MAGANEHVADMGCAVATASAIALPEGDTPEWVQLLPYGTWRGRDGRGPYTLRDAGHAAQVITATQAHLAGAQAPVDYEHQTQAAATNGMPAPASGWITDYQARDDGLYGRVDWTRRGADHLAAREYRYISPTFAHAKDGLGTVLRIVGAGLTNLPNFEIPAIASQGDHMDPIQMARHALGLADTASVADIVTAAQAALTNLAAALHVAGDATVPALVTAAQSLGAQSLGAQAPAIPDPARYVPMDAHIAVASQLRDMQAQAGQAEAQREVDEAVKTGRLTPAMRDWGLAYASQDLTGFKAYIAKAPVLVATARQTPPAAPAQVAGATLLTAEQIAVANQLGMGHDVYAQALAGEDR